MLKKIRGFNPPCIFYPYKSSEIQFGLRPVCTHRVSLDVNIRILSHYLGVCLNDVSIVVIAVGVFSDFPHSFVNTVVLGLAFFGFFGFALRIRPSKGLFQRCKFGAWIHKQFIRVEIPPLLNPVFIVGGGGGWSWFWDIPF